MQKTVNAYNLVKLLLLVPRRRFACLLQQILASSQLVQSQSKILTVFRIQAVEQRLKQAMKIVVVAFPVQRVRPLGLVVQIPKTRVTLVSSGSKLLFETVIHVICCVAVAAAENGSQSSQRLNHNGRAITQYLRC